MIGYARVSTEGQELNLQTDALVKAGCAEKDVYIDKASGTKESRPGWDKCIAALKPGDTLVVWRLDRVGRSVPHLVRVVNELLKNQINFKPLCDPAFDTTQPQGKFVLYVISALAEFERDLIVARTKAGLAAAKERGRLGGRKPISPSDPTVLAAQAMRSKGADVPAICKGLKVSRPTVYRYLAMNMQASTAAAAA
jgi:DNA invertase Pin-like site-specific DNA recombinase